MSGRDERQAKDHGLCGRPDRRCLQHRHNAVLEVIQGKATIIQIARCLGVRPGTVAWRRDAALAGIDSALMWSDGPTEREIEVEDDTLPVGLTRNSLPTCYVVGSHDLDWPRSGGRASRTGGMALPERVDGLAGATGQVFRCLQVVQDCSFRLLVSS
jgi:hypothetical protein